MRKHYKYAIKALVRTSILTAGLMLTPSLAIAQDTEGDDVIVVDGVIVRPEKQIPKIFDNNSGQLARFEGEFCPFIAGLPEEYATSVLRMVRSNATKLGLTVPENECRANALIIFTNDAPTYMAELRKKRAGWFSTLTARNKRLLTKNKRKFYAWHDISSIRLNGGSSANFDNESTALAGAISSGNGPPGQAEGRFGAWNSDGGRIDSPVEDSINSGFIVMDLLQTNGMTFRQLADFATLHLLMDIDVDAQKKFPANSILNLFDVKDPASLSGRMTDVDRLTAKGLYDIRTNNKTARIQSRNIARYVRDNIDEAGQASDNDEEQEASDN